MIDDPWIRGVEERNLANSRDIDRLKKDSIAQQSSLNAGLQLLPRRIAQISEQTATLSIPISGTNITYTPDLPNIPASTWTTVQNFIIPAPRGKTNVSAVLIATPVIRASTNSNNFRLVRLQINSDTYVQSTSGETGFCTGGGTFSGVSALNVSAQVYIAAPGSITNNTGTGRENCMRTFYMTVWS